MATYRTASVTVTSPIGFPRLVAPHVELEARYAVFLEVLRDQLHLLHTVEDEVEPGVHPHQLIGDLTLPGKGLREGGGAAAVLDHGGDPAGQRAGRLGVADLVVGRAPAHVHMRIDHSGEDQLAPAVDRLFGRGQVVVRSDGDDLGPAHGHAAAHDAQRRDHVTVPQYEICFHGLPSNYR